MPMTFERLPDGRVVPTHGAWQEEERFSMRLLETADRSCLTWDRERRRIEVLVPGAEAVFEVVGPVPSAGGNDPAERVSVTAQRVA